MDNRKLGSILLIVCLALAILVFLFNTALNEQTEAGCECTEMQEGGVCSMDDHGQWQTYAGVIIIAIIAALGLYLIFFEKSQKAIISTLEKQKQIQFEEEKLEILLKALNPEEQKIIKAVKEQDGITQQTLKFRIDMHKSKLSLVLDSLEKKDLIKRVEHGKTKQVFLKINI